MSIETLRQAIALAKSGDKSGARHLLESIIQQEPNNETAWIWMTDVAESDYEKKICLEKVLAINPNNLVAREGLKRLGGAPVPSATADASVSVEPPPVVSTSLPPTLQAGLIPAQSQGTPPQAKPATPRSPRRRTIARVAIAVFSVFAICLCVLFMLFLATANPKLERAEGASTVPGSGQSYGSSLSTQVPVATQIGLAVTSATLEPTTATVANTIAQTPTPRPTETPTFSPTPLQTDTPAPTYTPTEQSTATSTPIMIVPTESPVSPYYAPLSTQGKGGDSILTLSRVEFWKESKSNTPQNGLYLVLLGSLSSSTGHRDCPTASDFVLEVQGRTYVASSTIMGEFKSTYNRDYPGSFLGQCVTEAQPTYLAYDVPLQLGESSLTFRGSAIELGDLGTALKGSQIPTPSSEDQVKAIVERALGKGNRSIARVQAVDISENLVAGGKNIRVTWAINDNLSEDWIRDGAKIDATKLFQALYTSGFSVAQVESRGTFSMVDKYGNASEDLVVRLLLDRQTASKINWSSFLYTNIYRVVSMLYIHPAFLDK